MENMSTPKIENAEPIPEVSAAEPEVDTTPIKDAVDASKSAIASTEPIPKVSATEQDADITPIEVGASKRAFVHCHKIASTEPIPEDEPDAFVEEIASTEPIVEATAAESDVYTTPIRDPVDASINAPETADAGTEAAYLVCIDQLCQAAEICAYGRYDEEVPGEAIDPEKVCRCDYDLFYDSRDEMRRKLQEQIVSMEILAGFMDEFMIFFIEDLLDALFGRRESEGEELGESGEREMVPVIENDNVFLWMSYFYMHYCGYQLFLSSLAVQAGQSITAKQEMAAIISDLVDEVAQSGEYLDSQSELPERIAKNMIWGMLNTRRFHRRYIELTEAQVLASDIIDDIIDRMDEIKKDVSHTAGVRFSVEGFSDLPGQPSEVIQSCKEFMGIDKVADTFITELIVKSKDICILIVIRSRQKMKRGPSNARGVILLTEEARAVIDRIDRYINDQFINDTMVKAYADDSLSYQYEFPSIQLFSVEIGSDAIHDFINTWDYAEAWIYDIRFLMAQSDACSDYYFYEVNWSIPTVLYPVPQTTASILFRIEVSRVKPPMCLIDVTYKFEGKGLVHSPYQYPFQEKWLFDILYSKLKLYEKLRF